eukprot:TRINITY_DN35026_c0_g1_i1.p1 TRINITY_DN35026_c0_g1~~TRINITY_DN35026_c0_g1_i1.p1  ORF type:complete len:907 (+),score=314.50 TRINITY_DN35026_c0_g1_i1:35-2722(+)
MEGVEQFVAMGFSRKHAEEAVAKYPGSKEQATNWLLSNPDSGAGTAGGSREEDDMQIAINQSLGTSTQAGPTQPDIGDNDAQLQQVLMESMMTGDAASIPQIAKVQYSPVDMVKPSPDLPVGLKNVGNTCYVNTFLQLYFNIRPFRDLILRMKCDADTFLYALQLTFVRMWHSEKKFVDPTLLLQHMKDSFGKPYRVGQQEDVAEFNDTFLSNIEEGMHECPDELKQLRQMVEGSTTETYRVSVVDYEKQKTDQYRTVVLPVDPQSESLYDLLDSYTDVEVLRGCYKYDLPRKDGEGVEEHVAEEAVKGVFFSESLPGILAFQLQRASYIDGVLRKNNQQVAAPQLLDMSRYVSCNEVATRATRERVNAIRDEIKSIEAEMHDLTNVEATGKSLDELIGVMEKRIAGVVAEAVDQDKQRATANAFALIREYAAQESDRVTSLRTRHAGCKRKLKEISEYDSSDMQQVPHSSYVLSGILMHDGADTQSGHYWACIGNGARWYRYNDITVTELSDTERAQFAGQHVEGGAPAAGHNNTAYCIVYTRSDLVEAASLCGTLPRVVEDLRQIVVKENVAHSDSVREWEDSMRNFAPAYDKKKEEYTTAVQKINAEKASGAGGVLTVADLVVASASADGGPMMLSLSRDERVASKFAFALCKYEESENIMRVLPVAEAYAACFTGGDLIQDWQGNEHTPRAEAIAKQTDVTALLYPTKNLVTYCRTSYEGFLRANDSLLQVLKMLNTKRELSNPDSVAVSWNYVCDTERIEKAWRDERHTIVLLELLVRWMQQLAVLATNVRPTERMLQEPLNYVARIASGLPGNLPAQFRELCVASLTTPVTYRQEVERAYFARTPPTRTTVSVATTPPPAVLADDLLVQEELFYPTVTPETLGLLAGMD